MKSWQREVGTHFSLIDRFVDLAGLPNKDSRIIKKELTRYMRVRLDRGYWIPANITRFHSEWYREFYRVLGIDDPYREIKKRSNDLAVRLLGAIEIRDFRQAALASIVANKLDFGVLDFYDNGCPLTVRDFDDLSGGDLWCDDLSDLEETARRASNILYVVDNHGEILFDKLLMRHIKRINPTVAIVAAAKSEPMLNDATCGELEALGFGEVCEIVSTGCNSFGAPPEEVSEEFKRAYHKAELVIAKGQANFEFWIDFSAENMFHLLFTKFPVVDKNLREVPAGVKVVLSSRRYAEGKPEFRFS